MLHILLFDEFKDIKNYLELEKIQKLKFVTPNPSISDNLRAALGEKIFEETIYINTYSEFFRQTLNDIEVSRKEELYLLFSHSWRRILKNSNFFEFNNVFRIFTQLRGHVLDTDIMMEVCADFPPLVKNGILLFQNLLKELELIDEHRGCQLITELDQKEIKKFNHVFWNFSILTPMQVDMIKSLGKEAEIYIAYPSLVYEKRHPFDWITWLDSDATIVNCTVTIDRKWKKIIQFSEGELIPCIEQVKEIEFDNNKIEFVICDEQINFFKKNEIPFSEIELKETLDIFGPTLVSLDKILDGYVIRGLSVAEIGTEIKSEMTKITTNSNVKDYKLLKAMMLLTKRLEAFGNLSSELSFSNFEQKVLLEVVSLNTPRTYMINIIKEPEVIKKMTSVKYFDAEKTIERNYLVVLANSYDLGKESDSEIFSAYPKLAVLGPIVRPQLLMSFNISILNSYKCNGQSILMVEQDSIENNSQGKEILGGIVPDIFIDKSTVVPVKTEKIETIRLSEGNISAQKLQLYHDCPKKFYFRYVENCEPMIEMKTIMTGQDIGILQHQIICDYFERSSKIEEIDNDRILNLIEINISKDKIAMFSYFDRRMIYYQIFRAVKEVYKILKALTVSGKITFQFEKEIDTNKDGRNHRGRIDLLLKVDDDYHIIDFKKTGLSIPTKKELADQDSIQLLYYLEKMNGIMPDFRCKSFAYVALDDVRDSLVITDDRQFKEKLSESVDCRYYLVDSLESTIHRFEDWEKKKIECLEKEEYFLPEPRNASVCNFCYFSNVCEKSEAKN
ncbi:PD-(D/E)XK nuclease family protein [Bacteriovoracaceae bacterium]|nr:PD-(D/E)XK nuclease family protein [Bacteriovoracaceae bacterium]